MVRAARFFEALARREHALVMGVVNVTPDSFSDGGRHSDPAAAAAAGHAMARAGAALVDVGGESTRPGARAIDPGEEIARVLPVLRLLEGLETSIDTRRAQVAERALDAGVGIVNDVSAGSDPAMFPLVAERGAGLVLMHMRGEPATMQEDPRYDDVEAEVTEFLLARATAAQRAGVAKDRILLDPGIGFGKTAAHNLALLEALPRLAAHGFPVVVGLSRKRFLGEWTGRGIGDRGAATTAACALAATLGAALLRVHEVEAALDAARVAAAFSRVMLGSGPRSPPAGPGARS
ncbi:MAG: dihydropteroate synthase [Planctomycetaceae bacterium]